MYVTTSLWEFDKNKIWETWELPRWAKVNVAYRRQEEGKEDEVWECIATFIYMDWMYWRWEDEQWRALIFNWRFKQISDDFFIFYDTKEWEASEKSWDVIEDGEANSTTKQ